MKELLLRVFEHSELKMGKKCKNKKNNIRLHQELNYTYNFFKPYTSKVPFFLGKNLPKNFKRKIFCGFFSQVKFQMSWKRNEDTYFPV